MDDPDWMNEFQTPTENVLMDLSSPSSSPCREKIAKREQVSETGEEASMSNGKDLSHDDGDDDEDSLLISSLQYSRAGKKGRKGLGGGISMSQGKVEKSPSKLSAKVGRKGAVGGQEEEIDAESPNVGARRPRAKNKRALEFEEEDDDDDGEYQVPSKVRKTSASPKVNKATPSSGRKGRRVSFSEEDTPQLKKVKREDPVAIDEDDGEPISSLVRKKDKRPTAATTTTVSPPVADDSKLGTEIKEPRGTFALASLRDPIGTAADGEDAVLTQEEATQGELGEGSERKGKPRATSNLPVVFAEKVHRTKVLLECEGDALDLSGDMGAVGRFSVDSGKENGEDELFLDLKGIIYKTTIVPSNTFFVVNVGQAEAKVEAIMNDFMQLRPDINQVEDETLVEGTLEGFGFDLDNDGEPLSTPATAAGPVDGDSDDDTKKKKKVPTKEQKQKKVAAKGGKGSRAKGAGKKGKCSNRRSRRACKESKRRGKGAASKKPRAKAKATTKKPSKTKPTAAKGAKSKKS
ncbi:unnamed protein product [Calypogeia fissa]